MAFQNNGRLPVESKAMEFDRIAKSGVMRAVFEVLFDQENRLRALENKQPVSRAAALAAFKTKFTGE